MVVQQQHIIISWKVVIMKWYHKYDKPALYYVKVQSRFVSNTVRDGSYLTDYVQHATLYTYEEALTLLTMYDSSHLEIVQKD